MKQEGDIVIDKLTYTAHEFKEKILKPFSEAVKAKQYKKIDYAIYKYLANEAIAITFEHLPKSAIIRIDGSDKFYGNTYTFAVNDQSLGEYIFLTYYIKNMGESTLSTNTEVNTTTTDWKQFINQLPDIEYTLPDNAYLTIDTIPANQFNTNKATISTPQFDDLEAAINQRPTFNDVENMINNKQKENNKMKGINFDFGPCNGEAIRMSMYGLAVKTPYANKPEGMYVAYDPKTDSIMDVDIFNFDGSKFFYKIPVPIKNVKKGDVVVHNRRPCFVLDYGPNSKSLIVVDPIDGEKKEIMLTRSPFGFDFATKVVGLMDMCGQGMTATEDNPFGNMWMFAMMDGNMNDMLPLMMMANGGGNMNPMMMYFMMNNEDKDNLLPLMFMMNNNN